MPAAGERELNESSYLLAGVAVVVLIGTAGYLWRQHQPPAAAPTPTPPVASVVSPTPAPAASAAIEPGVKHPIETPVQPLSGHPHLTPEQYFRLRVHLAEAVYSGRDSD
jgi:hypothetical protein